MASLTPDLLLEAYANGFFPMAERKHSKELHWFCPEWRGVIPLEGFHIPRSLKKFMEKHPLTVTFDTAFPDVLAACADRKSTWINGEITTLYNALHRRGFAHSVECWREGALAGGLYGVSIGAAFFGESMFSRASNASKVALVHLVERLKARGFLLLDTQYLNDHLKQFGAHEIPRGTYMERLREAVERQATF
ncbi:MAG: leucyl/phenylalanyl-tRNA--protein transferase [Alphaproteobacteria bacterium]|nr:leucyl/phenylalanyl-tRNA--protein transferase [Alphaproteobacteria bacterium]